MLTFDALSARPTMTLNMREQRDAACACCSTLTSHDGRFDVATYDYDAFLSSTPCPMRGRKARRGGVDVNAPPKFGAREMPERDGGGWRRVDAKAATTYVKDEGVTVVDVRPKHMYDAAHIPGSISLPIETLDVETWNGAVCAGGNNSQRAAQWFVDAKVATAAPASVVDVCGGLAAMRDAGYDVPRLD
jgi:rhodanese-related sulfurtransferase